MQGLYLALCPSQYGCRSKVFLACKAFVRRVFVVNTWLYYYDIWYSFSVFVFEIELEAQLSHYETHCSKRFLLKSLLTGSRRDVAIRPDDSKRRLKSLLLSILSLVLTNVSYSLQHFSSGVTRLIP